MRLLSYRIRAKAKRHSVSYSFLFMRASGEQLREIASLIDAGAIRPVVDRIFPFESPLKFSGPDFFVRTTLFVVPRGAVAPPRSSHTFLRFCS